MVTAVLAIIFVTALAAPSQAQVVSDPRIAEFDPSPDHWQTLDSGQPAVVRYELGVYMCGASAPFTTIDMGKPSPEGDGKIRFDFSSSVTAWPLPGGNYEARVSAVGPEGSAPSEPSNPFTFSTGSSCTYAVSAVSFQVPAAGTLKLSALSKNVHMLPVEKVNGFDGSLGAAPSGPTALTRAS